MEPTVQQGTDKNPQHLVIFNLVLLSILLLQQLLLLLCDIY